MNHLFRHDALVGRWEATLKTAETIRTGVPQAKVDYADRSPADQERMLRGRHADTLAAGRDLVSQYDFSSYRHLIDVAGGSGGLSIALARACSSLRATVVDQPSVTPVTQRIVDETEVSDRVSVVAADAVSGPLVGTYDVAVLRFFIQVLSPEQAGQAIKSVGQVIEPGGRIYVIGAILDNSHITPVETAVLNLGLLNTFDHGQAYTEREYENWLLEAGFGDCQRSVQANGVSIMTAEKTGS